jgi:tetrapyrrole methylase family protein / MazG family protein
MVHLANLNQALTVFKIEDISILSIMAVSEMMHLHVPPIPPDVDLVILGFDTGVAVKELTDVLSNVYPQDHEIKIAMINGQGEPAVESIKLERLTETLQGKKILAALIPRLPRGSSFEQFQEIVAHLRAPEGCPWDREQTHLTLRKHLIEESYETLDAIDSGNSEKMCEEFGDLLLQIVLNAQIAFESNEFTMTEVFRGIYDKIVRRHPHVFGEVEVSGVGNVLQNWEKIKAAERESNGKSVAGLLDGLPAALPGLVQAQEMQSRVARVGFDWPEIEGVLEKINEEIDEIRSATNVEELASEIGDLFFALVNLARWKGIDAESALRETNRKFKKRFAFIEKGARGMERRISDLSLDEMESLWQSAKKSD